jgi:hypothetical protein
VGLESTEFVIAVEKALGLAIPDGDFRAARTPRELVNYLVGRMSSSWAGAARRFVSASCRRPTPCCQS